MLTVRGHSGGRWRWLRIPIELVRAVYRGRSMVPVPLTYLAATLAGIGLGVIADVVVGWPWWLVAAAFVAAVWLFFLASALWAPSRGLGDDLWMAIDPVRAREREFRRLDRAVASGELTCFEVAGWEGSRSLGGWGGSTRPERITLRHGDPRRDARWVSVTSRTGRGTDAMVSRDRLGRELLRTGREEPPEGLDLHEMHRWRIEQRRRLEQLPAPAWSPDLLSVDGQARPCEFARVGDRWGATTLINDSTIEVIGTGIELASVSLQRLATLEAYVREPRDDRRGPNSR